MAEDTTTRDGVEEDTTDGSSAAGEPAESKETAAAGGADTGPIERGGRREVVLPPRLYKAVTVFTTLLAIAAVVGGFVLIDEATGRATRPLSEVNVPLAIVGVGLIAAAALQYAYAQRFRAAGMATDKSSEDRPSDDG